MKIKAIATAEKVAPANVESNKTTVMASPSTKETSQTMTIEQFQVLIPHEHANLFPTMNDRDFLHFKKDIEVNGQQEALVLYDGKVLDGRNRYRALSELLNEGKINFADIKTRELPEGSDTLNYVFSANLHRRHLNESQRALVGARIIPMLRPEAEKRAKSGKKAMTAFHCNAQAAKMVNVSTSSVAAAWKLLEQKNTVLLDMIDRGLVRVGFATTLAGLKTEEFNQVLTAANERLQEKAMENQQHDGNALSMAIDNWQQKLDKKTKSFHDGLSKIQKRYQTQKDAIGKIGDETKRKTKEDDLNAKIADLEQGKYPEALAKLAQTISQIQGELAKLKPEYESITVRLSEYQDELRNEIDYPAFLREAYSQISAEATLYSVMLVVKWVDGKFDAIPEIRHDKKGNAGYLLAVFDMEKDAKEYLKIHETELVLFKNTQLSDFLNNMTAQVKAIASGTPPLREAQAVAA